MADKMMRIAGRNNDGIAKPLEINDNGGIKTDELKRYIDTSLSRVEPGEAVVVADLPVEDYRYLKFAGHRWSDSSFAQLSLEIRCYTGDDSNTILYTKDYVKIAGGNITTPFNQTLHTVDIEEVWGERVELVITNTGISPVNIPRKDITLFKTSHVSSNTLGLPFNFMLTIGEGGEIPYLDENMSSSKVMITADVNNKNIIKVAPSPQSTSGSFPLALAKPLQPGQWTTWEVRNLRYLGVRGTLGDVVYVEGVL